MAGFLFCFSPVDNGNRLSYTVNKFKKSGYTELEAAKNGTEKRIQPVYPWRYAAAI